MVPLSAHTAQLSAPSLFIFKFGNKEEIFQPADAGQPAKHNFYSPLINEKVCVIADKYDVQECAVTKYKEILPTT